MKFFYLLTLLMYAPLTLSSKEAPAFSKITCLAAQEYITTLNFFRQQKSFALNETESQKISQEVAQGCTGASKRFISITNLLIKANLDSRSAIKTASLFIKRESQEAEAFMEIFRKSFLERYLDLDLKNAIEVALELSQGISNTPYRIMEEFKNLVNFCVKAQGLDLPRPQCAKLAISIVKAGQGFAENISAEFIKLFTFLTNSKKGDQTTGNALKIAERVMQFGPAASDNFITAFEFGFAEKGMKLANQDAIKFAEQISSYSSKSINPQLLAQ